MISLGDTMIDSAQRPLALRMRADLIVSAQTFQGRQYWMVKDPLTLQFYRFEEEEYRLLCMLDGLASSAEIQAEFQRRFAPQRLSMAQLTAFVTQLFRQSLVVSDATGQGEQLLVRRQERRRNQLLAGAANLLAIRLPGPNPDRLLTGVHKLAGWLFSLPFVIGTLVLMLGAGILVTVEFDTFIHRLPGFEQFFARDNWLLLALVLGGTKVLHELGHGVVCKRFGGECHEMGIMFLVFTPCLYCNVSDSWMLPSKWKRAAIGMAGIYVELVLASLATFVWWFSQPGLLHYLCLNVMFVCSVNTFLFNGNPLLRYDGYYVLSDLVEIPNLRQKARDLIGRLAAKWFCGVEPAYDPFLPQRHRWFLYGYGLAASVYRWMILSAILWFLYQICASHGLRSIGKGLLVLAALGLAVDPVRRTVGWMRSPPRRHKVKKFRIVLAGSILVAAAVLLLAWPLPYRIHCRLNVEPGQARAVYVEVPGVLRQTNVIPGQPVRSGQKLALLQNHELDRQISKLEFEQQSLEVHLQSLRQRAHYDQGALSELSEATERLTSLRRRLARRREQRRHLVLKAPADGVVLPSRRRDAVGQPGSLPFWTGHPWETENQGAFLAQGVSFCRIGSPTRGEAIIEIDEDWIEFVRSGQPVDLLLTHWPDRPLHSRIREIARSDSKSDHVTNREPSGFAADDRGDRRRPTRVYRARVPIELDSGHLLVHGTGTARIDVGRRSLGRRCWDSLQRTFRWEW